MKKATKYLCNSLTGMLFIALLAVNVQVGSGNSFLGIGEASVNEAKAAYCNPMPVFCTIDLWGNIIWGEFHEGFPTSN